MTVEVAEWGAVGAAEPTAVPAGVMPFVGAAAAAAVAAAVAAKPPGMLALCAIGG